MNKQIDITGVELKTARLTLRPWRQADLEDFYEYARVDGVGQMAGWQPHESIQVSQEILNHFIEGKKTFALVHQGKVIGSLGIERYNEQLFPQLAPYLGRAIGYVLSRDYWGRGLMPEAVQAVKEYLFEREGLDFINVGHFAWNRQSARVIEKSGFAYFATIPYHTHVGTVEEDFEYLCFHPKYAQPPVKTVRAGILCAADDELHPFLSMMHKTHETKKALLTFHHGTIDGLAVTAVWCGACKVNAAIAAQLLIDTFGCDFIINAGTCGGMTGEMDVMDTVVSAECAYHDVEAGILTEYHPYLPGIWFQADGGLLQAARAAAERLPRHKIAFGRTMTGEAFIDNRNRDAILMNHAPLSVDMETAAAAQVCHAFGTPFLAVRTITDTPAHDGDAAYHANCEAAGQAAADITRQTLQEWKRQRMLK